MSHPIKAYIFDMDGTLVDNCAYHVKAWRKFSKAHGRELTEKELKLRAERQKEVREDEDAEALREKEDLAHDLAQARLDAQNRA